MVSQGCFLCLLHLLPLFSLLLPTIAYVWLCLLYLSYFNLCLCFIMLSVALLTQVLAGALGFLAPLESSWRTLCFNSPLPLPRFSFPLFCLYFCREVSVVETLDVSKTSWFHALLPTLNVLRSKFLALKNCQFLFQWLMLTYRNEG